VQRREIKPPAVLENQLALPPGSFPIAFSPEGHTLAAAGFDLSGAQDDEQTEMTIRLWEVSSGRERRRLQVGISPQFGAPGGALGLGGGGGLLGIAGGGQQMLSSLAFAPGGRRLSYGAADTIYLWDVARKREVRRFGGRHVTAGSFAFTPDGKLLAAGSQDGKIHLWDVRTGTALAVIEAHRGGLTSLALSADGKVLATAGTDTTAVVWDVARLLEEDRPEAVRLSGQRLEGLWADLAGANAARAFDAICALASDPGPAIPFLRTRLHPVPRPDRATIEKLIAELNSERFEVRKRAADELEKLADLAEPALRQALDRRPPLEVRRRIEKLLAQIEGPVTEPEQLRVLRAIEALERIGTAEARQVLEALAKGAPEARLTREAQAALERTRPGL
jgi:hypothetical protein